MRKWAIGAAASGALAGTVSERTLLTQEFEPRNVAQIDVGIFHFTPGQLGPLHQHAAPVFGYVSKRIIYYQVEGQAPQILKAGVASHVDVIEQLLVPLGDLAGARQGETIAAYVAEGVVSVRVGTEAPVIYQTGQTFYVARSGQRQFNPSRSQAARVVLFRLTNRA